ncbi:uncharacterized protein SPPG_04607 [Spizellomyces punctatus DAOM BR117]|uniref:Bet v I/Major latex protein domain-containing protein n=1 Tax=Spizellomyces punctatus (strain DAOM BR117) TaxID=645134 RepID=A0A0L0HGQ4_SPIPD|nr:uncharacterized protein SPPG_04607 [Spizellomyces punctatus DAOM BR117]KND00278.1 hypothetical protein SPPG_04607 [Spizellomyces punctatus DAOM BR117]|eukprot:XP_016608317.1 hypothetical protein SPPG_04607 [Spizellomyces punctatus DAOM BR117]
MDSATRVQESRVFPHPINVVWNHVRPADFKFWTSAVKETQVEGGLPGEVGSQRKVTFKDGTVQRYQIVELSDLAYFITYEMIESNPPIKSSAALHTIKLRKITHDNSTLVEWESDYSSSGNETASVVEDSRLKKKEALQDLAKALGSK